MLLKCSTTIKNQSNICRHRKHCKNTPLKRKKLVCETCGKEFDFQSKLNEYKKEHSDFT